MSNLATAIALASEGFKNKTDKAGEPYILHCLRVMNNLKCKEDKERMIIAVLHDVVEDKVCTMEHLINLGFSIRVIQALTLLTHDKSVEYQQYIKALSYNEDARQVKLADLKDNSDITRLKGLSQKDFTRMEKYHVAYTYLSKI